MRCLLALAAVALSGCQTLRDFDADVAQDPAAATSARSARTIGSRAGVATTAAHGALTLRDDDVVLRRL